MFSRGTSFLRSHRVRRRRTTSIESGKAGHRNSAFLILNSSFAPHHWSIIKKVKVPVATSFPSALDSSTWITDRVCPSFLGVATQVI